MRCYQLKILTPQNKFYDGEAAGITVTCEDGLLTVLAGHAPMVAALVAGSVTVRTEEETLEGTAGDGLLQVDSGEVALLVSSFQWAGDEQPEADAEEDAADIML